MEKHKRRKMLKKRVRCHGDIYTCEHSKPIAMVISKADINLSLWQRIIRFISSFITRKDYA